jgi:hypothetical protein
MWLSDFLSSLHFESEFGRRGVPNSNYKKTCRIIFLFFELHMRNLELRYMTSSFWNHVIQISSRQVHFQDIYFFLLIIKYVLTSEEQLCM